eukprot:TRINITY_DN12089_c0_g1_i2.p1 TRINITY_DN12089_c0_g1~~TRINITY_DN12089_c0_g1_i2.p1  ORF type:complete len:1061 (+),score=193.83 TRINITY_DN12089_c0_g1_i2:86-3268(+)
MAVLAIQIIATLLLGVNAQRSVVNFDFAWRHHLGLLDQKASCPASAFPYNKSGHECYGLEANSQGDESAEACRQACCVQAGCAVWQWQSTATTGGGCWTGNPRACSKSDQSNWIGQGRNTSGPWSPLPNNGANVSLDDSNWAMVDAPHDYSINGTFSEKGTGSGHSYLPRNYAWYRKHFRIPSAWQGGSIWLYFQGVFRITGVYVNGNYVRRHDCGYTSFAVRLDNITTLNYGNTSNVIALYVDAISGSGWWYEGSGLYRHVHLIHTGKVHVDVDGIATYSNLTSSVTSRHNPSDGRTASAVTTVKATVVNDGADETHAGIAVELHDQTGSVVARASSDNISLKSDEAATLRVQLPVRSAELWSIARPYLYTLVTRIVVGNTATDIVNTTIGIRSTNFTADKGMFMNDQPVKARGFCNHNDFEGVGMGIPDRVNLFRAQGLRGLGGNSWRMSHNPPIPTLLDILDRLGVIVMDENRLFDNISSEVADMADLVRRDRNHPSVVIWSFCNEVGCEGDHETAGPAFRAITYAVDGSRPTLGNMFSYNDMLSNLTDVQGFSHKDRTLFERFHASDPDRPAWASECCSCITMRGEDQANDTAYALTNFNADCLASQTGASELIDYVIGQMVWTAFDYYGEPSFGGWPHKSSSFGAYDLSGFSKAGAHWFRSWWLANISASRDDRPPIGHEYEVYVVESGFDTIARNQTTQVSQCLPNNAAQAFVLSGLNSTHFAIKQQSAGLCLPNYCVEPGDACYPLIMISCDNKDQVAFMHNGTELVGVQGICLDIHGNTGPNVGLYNCNQQLNQQWMLRDGQIVSLVDNKTCLTDAGLGIRVYSNAKQVEIYLDGKEALSVPMPYYSYVSVDANASHNITAVVRDDKGQVASSHTRLKPGVAVGLKLSLDAPNPATGTGSALVLDGQDVALLRVAIVDANGQVVPGARNMVHLKIVSGPGRVLAVGNGDPRCHEPNMVAYRSAYHGLMRGFIQVTEYGMSSLDERKQSAFIDVECNNRTKVNMDPVVSPSPIVVQASADGLPPATLTIKTSVDPDDSVLTVAANSVRQAYLL